MKKVYIIGAGGWGREVLVQMRDSLECDSKWTIAGFLDTRPHILDGIDCGAAVVGNPLTHTPRHDEFFVCAIGLPRPRQQFTQPLLGRGGEFIHIRTPYNTHGYLSARVHLGTGCFWAARVQISPDVWIGDFANIHSGTIIGHDARIGRYAQIGAMTFIGGGAQIGDFAIVHPNATVTPGVQIGEGATVGAGAVVLKNVAAGATVFGNPARVIF
ncbi:acetyltransferase [Delftia sp. HK171]|jgi:sugar O-acyltransferase (sialic acid O-acetyltransferase NeuD family)|uniref:acetyltransferase n=1 Tax=Delftia TaxID=80865 RepID=UPI0009037BB4|nr:MULTISPECIES: acetyltransferase [Delftia]APE46384.1 acetyltransferase [Delftia sp. HK171]MCA1071828.1 GDP-perosamine N-acetyltransferase [Delftia acidovorans]